MIKVTETENECLCEFTSEYYSLDILRNKKNLVLLSGGIDSQALCSYLKNNNVEYETLFADYSYNKHDGKFARLTGINHTLKINLNEFYFDKKIHLEYFKKYKCTSPQLAVHLYIIKYSLEKFPEYNILLPGHPLYKNRSVINLPDYTQLSYHRFCKKENLSNVYPYFFIDFEVASDIRLLNIHKKSNCNDYTKKFLLYEELGLKILQQEKTSTGFEEYRIFLKEEKKIFYDEEFRKPISLKKRMKYKTTESIF